MATGMRRPIGYDPSMDNAILLGVGSAHAVTSADKPRGQTGRSRPDPGRR